jgi:hypothetical protein
MSDEQTEAITSELIESGLNKAANIFGWPRHVVDEQSLKNLKAEWDYHFVGNREYKRVNFVRAFKKFLYEDARAFPLPSDIVGAYRSMRSQGIFGDVVL